MSAAVAMLSALPNSKEEEKEANSNTSKTAALVPGFFLKASTHLYALAMLAIFAYYTALSVEKYNLQEVCMRTREKM